MMLEIESTVKVYLSTQKEEDPKLKGINSKAGLSMNENRKIKVLIALGTLYLAWSSTYLAIRISLESFPPFFIAGFRYMLVGLGMYVYLRWRGAAAPTRT